MNKKDAAKNILFFLDDINDVRRRILGSEEIPELEIDMLRQQVLTLYQELNRYKRLAQEQESTPKAVYSAPQAKTEPVTQPAPVQEVKQESKPEPVKFEEPKREAAPPQPAMVKETPEPENKKEKLIEAEPVRKPEEPQTQPAESSADKIRQAYAKVQTKAPEPKPAEKAEKPASSVNERFQSTASQGSINERFAQHNVKTKLADKLKLSPISDLGKAISINQRVSFVRELFKGDEKEFKRVVAYVNSLRNFSEAKFYLESEIAKQYGWNDESPKMQEFMELVFRKFL